MKFIIKDEINGRLRVHLNLKRLDCDQADTLQRYLEDIPGVYRVKVYERTADAAITYRENHNSSVRSGILRALQQFSFKNDADTLDSDRTDKTLSEKPNSGRALNKIYKERLIQKVLVSLGCRVLLPRPLCALRIGLKSLNFIKKGIHSLRKGRMEVEVLDAVAITVSTLRGDFGTAGSVMMLLEIGEILEEWTHRKSVEDLARTMALHVDKVWLLSEDKEVLVSCDQIKENDCIHIHTGNVIPFDGLVVSGEAMVNQASMTGEALPVRKTEGSTVFAGTVAEEGDIIISVKQASGGSRYEKIITMIEESEKLKSNLESQAEQLADRLVPYTFLGTGLVYALTRDVTRTLSVLMVDFSCALKLAMPISVLSAIREAGSYGMTVKGGKFLEAAAEADTIVFDKTGTLTKAAPRVADVVAFGNWEPQEALRIAACLEEHFPHSIAKAVVDEAAARGLNHEEMHSKVDYIVAHGISTFIDNKKAIIGSHHFVFEDESCKIPRGQKRKFNALPTSYSHLYLAVEGKLAAVILIEDPLREEAADVICSLRESGFSQIVMMTGDNERTAATVAKEIGIDHYYSEVLPEDKAHFVKEERKKGHRVMMIGDGINDSPALSAADVGVAISDGAAIAREIADITLAGDDLYTLIRLRMISQALMRRIRKNYHSIVGINATLIALGILGVIQPTTSALFHNLSTLAIGMKSMTDLL